MTRSSTVTFSVDELDIIHYVDELQDQVWSIGHILNHLRSRYHFEKRSASARKGWRTRRKAEETAKTTYHVREYKVKGAQAP